MALEHIAELLRALAHPLRLQILDAVCEAELSVGEIEEVTGIGQPGLSQQLAVLRKAELVVTQRTGKQVFYRVDGERMQALAHYLGGRLGGAGPALPAGGDSAVAGETAVTVRGGAAGFARVLR
ncbi:MULTISPECIES: ArsR/SmtB family transcription factor [Sphingomonadaceae]|uniref:ArsR/SmtB family transcription factor n=1 Tax=Sphingomonadaceae TaxID=41297 RepID=UPI0011575A66|nr:MULTISPECIES: metalloregulator ArsR/SmtB family transcription factor [Sphingomonadaceae]QDK34439.1 transcriptional regulator [Sphingomonas sp. IC081]QSR16751.1 hypothetical protein CA833_06040 [Novosphingobium sp. KA1]